VFTRLRLVSLFARPLTTDNFEAHLIEGCLFAGENVQDSPEAAEWRRSDSSAPHCTDTEQASC
jgi:hypothetical protein